MTKYPIHLTEERSARIRSLASNRQMDFAIVLENVHDPHNIGAVMRTCDAVGIPKVFLLVSDARVWEKIELGIKASSGARKWVDVYIYDDYSLCFKDLRKDYDSILATHLSEESVSLYELDLTKSTALVFGNEHEGLTEEALSHIDGNFTIPQFGMVQSLNISVACAVSCYEALRQREGQAKYDTELLSDKQEILHQDYRQRNFIQHKGNIGHIISDRNNG